MQRGALLMRLGLFQSCSKVCNLQISTWVDNATLSIEPNFFFFWSAEERTLSSRTAKTHCALSPSPPWSWLFSRQSPAFPLAPFPFLGTHSRGDQQLPKRKIPRQTYRRACWECPRCHLIPQAQAGVHSARCLKQLPCPHLSTLHSFHSAVTARAYWLVQLSLDPRDGGGGEEEWKGEKKWQLWCADSVSHSPPLSLLLSHTYTHTLTLSLLSVAAPAVIAGCSQVKSYYRSNEFSITPHPIKAQLACERFRMLWREKNFSQSDISSTVLIMECACACMFTLLSALQCGKVRSKGKLLRVRSHRSFFF